MKKIINQKRYDTETARMLSFWENSYNMKDFQWCRETLYQKKTGEYFLHGEGGPMSRYAEPEGINSWTSGERLMPMSYEEARSWAEEHLDADEYDGLFGDIPEDEERITVTFSLPADTVEKLKRIIARDGGTQSDKLAELIREA